MTEDVDGYTCKGRSTLAEKLKTNKSMAMSVREIALRRANATEKVAKESDERSSFKKTHFQARSIGKHEADLLLH